MKLGRFFVLLPILAIPLTAQYTIEVVETWVISDIGDSLYTRISQPREDLYPGEQFSAVIYLPGGLGPGAMDVSGLAPQGFIEVHWNAPGRVSEIPDDKPSTGEEDYNGYIGQDALKSIVEYVMDMDNVVTDNVGIVSHSYGVTMAAGFLGRYPDMGIKYYVDKEGPSYDFVTAKDAWSLDEDPSNDVHEFTYAMFGHYSTYRDSTDSNRVWWSGRQALNFADSVSCYYMRIQAQYDHAQPPSETTGDFEYPPLWWPNKHASVICDKASWGRCPWVMINLPNLGNVLNDRYDENHRFQVYPGRMQDHPDVENDMVTLLSGMPTCDPPQVPENAILELQPTDEWLLTWSSNPEPDLAGYLVYSGDSGERQALFLEDTVWAPDTFYMISNWEFKHSYAVRAFDTTDLRSDLSVILSTSGIAERPELENMWLKVEKSRNFWEIRFILPYTSSAEIGIYDASGRRIILKDLGYLRAGEHKLAVDSETLGSGVYFIQLEIENLRTVSKIVCLQ